MVGTSKGSSSGKIGAIISSVEHPAASRSHQGRVGEGMGSTEEIGAHDCCLLRVGSCRCLSGIDCFDGVLL